MVANPENEAETGAVAVAGKTGPPDQPPRTTGA